MKNLQQMLTYVTVVECKSFSLAARTLNISATAVSKQIKKLEDALGVQLIQRSTRLIEITEIGAHFYKHCKQVESLLDETDNFIASFNEEPQGSLRIFASIHFGHHYLLPYIPEFCRLYPKVEIDIDLAERRPDVEKEHIDILFGFAMHEDLSHNLHYRFLRHVANILCASPHYLKQYGTPEKIDDLANHRLINHHLRHPPNKIIFKNGQTVYTHQPIIRTNQLGAMTALALAGGGIIQIPHFYADTHIQAGDLIHVLPKFPLNEIDVYLFYQHSKYDQLKIRLFLDFIFSKIEGIRD